MIETGLDTAMILAAGKGTRMQAQENDPPKPLIEIAGQSLLARMVARLVDAGISRLVVNVHHKADAMEAALAALALDFPALTLMISDERESLLETGGGVKKALALLGEAPFLVANADLLWQEKRPVLSDFIAAFDADKARAQLLLAACATSTGYDGRGDYHLAGDGRLRRAGSEGADYLFAGVQILSPCLFDDAPEGPFSLNEIYDKAEVTEGLYGHVLDGRWMHVGTPAGRAAAQTVMADQ